MTGLSQIKVWLKDNMHVTSQIQRNLLFSLVILVSIGGIFDVSKWLLQVQTVHSAHLNGTSITVVENGFHGGGFVSNVSISPDGEKVYAGGDVSGIHRSDNAGALFRTKNLGFRTLKIASVQVTPDNPDIVYAGTGDKGNSGGLYYSSDSGDTWQLTAASLQAQSGTTDYYAAAFFAGNHPAAADPIPDAHPRPNGNLIAVDYGATASSRSDDIVIAGTYKHGVQFFSAGGDAHESTVLSDGFIRGVSINPAIPDVAYVAAYFSNTANNGIYQINYTNLSNPIATLVYPTPQPEEVVLLASGNVYAAIGSNGIAAYDGSSWTTRNAGLLFDDEHVWQGIDGYTSNGQDIVYIGVNNSMTSSGNHYSNIWRSTNDGINWTPLVDQSSNVILDIYDGDTSDGGGAYWWFRDGFGEATLGRRNTVVSSIQVAHDSNNNVNDDEIYVSGRGGIWKSDDGGMQWYPAVNNFQTSTNRDIAVHPNNPAQVIVGNTDYTLIEGTNRLISGDVERDKPFDPYLGGSAGHRGYDVIFDAVADQAIVAAGDRDQNIHGEVFVKDAVDVGNLSADWTSLSLGPITTESGNTSGNRVRAITYGYHDGTNGTTQTILAAVEGQGIYRYHDGAWSQSTVNVPITSTQRSNFVWPDRENSGVVYLIDVSAGIYRSVDGGQNWQNIWTGMTLNNNDYWTAGYIAAHDHDPSVIYLSLQGRSDSYVGTNFRVYRLENADNPAVTYGDPDTDANVTDITYHSSGLEIGRPSALKVDSRGRLWLTQQQSSPQGDTAALFMMENPQSDTAFTDLTTPIYRQSVTEPIGIDVSSDGYIYVAQRGLGIAKIQIQDSQSNHPPTSASLDNTSISENNSLNTDVGKLSISDPDGDTTFVVLNAKCATPGVDDDFFKAGNYGALKVRSNDVSRIDGSTLPPLDYENPFDANGDNLYEICIVVRDQGGESLEQNLTIEVLDVDEGNDRDVTPPTYRFWSAAYRSHFFTTSQRERDSLIANDPNWAYEGVAFDVCSISQREICSPVYRFWSAVYRSHFYTISTLEKDALIANDPNWVYEGVAWYAHKQQQANTKPLYRFWSAIYKSHFFTTSQQERDSVIEKDPNWLYEGIAYYLQQ